MKRAWILACLACFWLQLPAQEADEPAPLETLPGRLLDAYLGIKPRDFLIDPQNLLRAHESRQRLDFLNYHSGDSLIDLYVCLIKGDQQMPADHDVADRARLSFVNGKPSVIVHYYLGRPERAQLYLSRRLDEVVPLGEQARALESSIERALTGGTPEDQLEKFVVQMAIRIYRMERLLVEGSAGPAPLDSDAPAEVPPSEGSRNALSKQALAIWQAQRAKLVGGVLVLLLLAWWRRRCRARATYAFAELDAEERLGAPHAAGLGAVVSFAKTSLPPAAQRERMFEN